MPGTVTVACKYPNGLQLQLQKSSDFTEHTIFGPRETKRWNREGKIVRINGPAHRHNEAPKSAIKGGFALTHGVEADFFDEWMRINKDSDLVVNGFIYAAAKQADAEAHARDYKDERCGLEPVDPNNLPAEFKRRVAPATDAPV